MTQTVERTTERFCKKCLVLLIIELQSFFSQRNHIYSLFDKKEKSSAAYYFFLWPVFSLHLLSAFQTIMNMGREPVMNPITTMVSRAYFIPTRTEMSHCHFHVSSLFSTDTHYKLLNPAKMQHNPIIKNEKMGWLFD